MSTSQGGHCCQSEHSDHAHGDDHAAGAAPETAIDPVCGMTVTIATAKHVLEHNGKKVYFCNPRCKEKFEADPEKYEDGPPAPEPMPAGTMYTCPMDPEIVQEGPGTCPI